MWSVSFSGQRYERGKSTWPRLGSSLQFRNRPQIKQSYVKIKIQKKISNNTQCTLYNLLWRFFCELESSWNRAQWNCVYLTRNVWKWKWGCWFKKKIKWDTRYEIFGRKTLVVWRWLPFLCRRVNVCRDIAQNQQKLWNYVIIHLDFVYVFSVVIRLLKRHGILCRWIELR